MKTIYKTLIVITILCGLCFAAYFTSPTVPFLKEYFEIKRTKIELAKPEKVDSLLVVISFQDSIIQNFNNHIDTLKSDFDFIKNQKDNKIQELENENKKLIETINLHTKIIKQLRQNETPLN
jgi:hypothetical protein